MRRKRHITKPFHIFDWKFFVESNDGPSQIRLFESPLLKTRMICRRGLSRTDGKLSSIYVRKSLAASCFYLFQDSLRHPIVSSAKYGTIESRPGPWPGGSGCVFLATTIPLRLYQNYVIWTSRSTMLYFCYKSFLFIFSFFFVNEERM